VLLNDYIEVGQLASAKGDASCNFTDVSGNTDTLGNFLNGNKMLYRIDTTYTIPNSSPITYQAVATNGTVIPYDQPIPTDVSGNFVDLTIQSNVNKLIVAYDQSNNVITPNAQNPIPFSKFKVFINKNGSNLTNLVAVTLNSDGSQSIVKNLTPLELNSIVYSNPQVSKSQQIPGIAADQYGSYTFDLQTPIVTVLCIENNAGGGFIFRSPAVDGPFGPNQYVPNPWNPY
jgi:hypothetical protein